MPGIVTRRFRLHNAEQFFEAFSEAAKTNMYLFISKVVSWSDEGNPPTPTDSIANTSYDFWRPMLAMKKVSPGDITYSIPRYDWANNTVYREYDHTNSNLYDTPASSNTFFTITDEYNVYKCLFNNGAAASTVKPTGTSTSILQTSDGYLWKYMYTVSAADALKYLTTNWQPVTTLTANNGSSQWLVQQAASNGSVDVIKVTAGGSSYDGNIGTFASVTNTSVMALEATASATDDIYNGSQVYVSSGTGAGQVSEVVNYVGSTKTVTLSPAFAVAPTAASTYVLGPKVLVLGDGSGATAYANVASGAVNYINVIDAGTNYSKTTISITANNGTGAAATGMVSPRGGHGSDPVNELAGHNVMLNVQLSGSESGTFPIVNDFRVFGLLKDPILAANGAVANGSTYDMTTRLTLSSVTGSGNFTQDELISGGTSTSTARVVGFANTNAANTAGILSVVSTNTTFVVAETITGNTSAVTGIIDSIAEGDVEKYQGDLLYIENRSGIFRSSDQIEDIKLIVKF